MENSRVEGHAALEDAFGDRFRRHADGEGFASSVLPTGAEEARKLAEIAARHGLTLVPVGAGTAPGSAPGGEAVDGAVIVRFDLMRGVRLPRNPEALWAEAEPGALWLQMDNELRLRGMGLAVYPTSAPRATVGGWLATDGLGVGSFEYGRIRENVLSASVVLPDGTLRELAGEELDAFIGPRAASGMVVGARLRTRRADVDVPFAAAFEGPAALESVAGAVMDLAASPLSLWHLAFLSPEMAAARGLGDEFLLFGAYSGDSTLETDLGRVIETGGGRLLDAARAHRCWGERFYPVTPSRPAPRVIREFVPLRDLRAAIEARPGAAVQCTISRSGEALLLMLAADDTATAR